MLSPQPPDPQLHRRLGQRKLQLLDLGSLSSLNRGAPFLPPGPGIMFSSPAWPASKNRSRHSATVFPVVPCRLAASAIVSSPDNTASTTRIRSSTGSCECPRRLISQSSQPTSKSDPAKKFDSVDGNCIELMFAGWARLSGAARLGKGAGHGGPTKRHAPTRDAPPGSRGRGPIVPRAAVTLVPREARRPSVRPAWERSGGLRRGLVAAITAPRFGALVHRYRGHDQGDDGIGPPPADPGVEHQTE